MSRPLCAVFTQPARGVGLALRRMAPARQAARIASPFPNAPKNDAAWRPCVHPEMSDSHREFWRAQLASHLSGLFDPTDPAALAEIEADAEWVSLSGGETLFRRGDPGDAAYIVISGRLRVVDEAAGDRTLSEIGAGETLGEMALLSGERRSATVYAVRDSLLAKLSAEGFNRLVERHPRVLRRIAGFLVERLRRQGTSAVGAKTGVKTVALVPAGDGAAIGEFSRLL